MVAGFVLLVSGTGWSKVICVDDDALPPGDGASWETAYTYLQDALMMASSGDEIRVAQGIYKPDDFVLSDRPNLGRAESFQLKNEVAIRGGYTGMNMSNPDERDIELYETILSGDLDGNDGPNFANNSENSFHVVIGYQTESMDKTTEVLDGFTITGGNANSSSYPDNRGGGMYCNSDATVSNCTFTGNFAAYGGGMYCGPTWCCVTYPIVTNCTFIGNSAGNEGGGMWIGDSDPKLTNCIISGNSVDSNGGGIMFGNDNFTTMVSCLINGNSAGKYGGGIYGVFCFGWTMTNCTVTENLAGEEGGGIYNQDGSDMTLTNCILWGNYPEEISGEWIDWVTVNHCCIQGGYPGTGNIDADPMFKDADGPDNILGTADDNLQLAYNSPCIDAGNNMAVPADTADLDGDGDTTERIPLDLAGNARFTDDPLTADTGVPDLPDYPNVVDMGAYERYEFCGDPGQALKGDLNLDCYIDLLDFAIMTTYWLQYIGPE